MGHDESSEWIDTENVRASIDSLTKYNIMIVIQSCGLSSHVDKP